MVKWFKSLFAWKDVFQAGVYMYQENTITGERRCIRYISGGYSPKDTTWLTLVKKAK